MTLVVKLAPLKWQNAPTGLGWWAVTSAYKAGAESHLYHIRDQNELTSTEEFAEHYFWYGPLPPFPEAKPHPGEEEENG